MKEKLFRMCRSGMCLLLALCMVVGMFPGVAFAEEAEKETINYVSIGDSMANGYGFVGYNQTSDDLNEYDFLTGHGMYGEGAYPLQFEEYLTEQGYDVNHTKLATSAMLAEDLLYLLGGRSEMEDGWDGWKDYVGEYDEAIDSVVKPHVKKAIEEADLITMGIGNAGFGAYMLNMVTSALGVFGASLDDDQKMSMENAIAHLTDAEKATWRTIEAIIDAEVNKNVTPEMAEEYNLVEAMNIVKYTAVSFIVNYADLVEKMLELNPDVNVILVGLLNTTYGMNITDDNGNVILAVGDMMDSVFNALNMYMAAVPTTLGAEGEFYFAEQPNPKFICQVFEELKNNGWDDIDPGKDGVNRLSGTTIRNRNIDAFNGSLGYMIGMAVTGTPLTRITLADVQAYEDINWTALTQAGQNPWGAFMMPFNSTGKPYMTDLQTAKDTIMAVAIYLGIEEAVANSTNTMDIPMSGLLKIAGDLSSVFADLGTPPTDSPESSRTWLLNGLSTDETQGMCKIYGLFKVGNGMSVHPTPTGHDEIAARVIKAYEEGHTAEKETDENLEGIEGMPVLMDIYTYLRSNELIETEQTYSIINFVLERLNDETLSGEELMETARFVYETLLHNDKLNDEQRIDIVENVCDILEQHEYLDSYKKELDVLKQIVALPELANVTNEQAFDIVDCIYNEIKDGEVIDTDVRVIAEFIYVEVLGENSKLTDAEKVSLIIKLYNIAKVNGYLSNADAQALKVLEEILALPELSKITPAQTFAIFNMIVTAIREGNMDDAKMGDIANDIYETVLGGDSLTDAEKVALIEKVYNILKENGYLDNVDGDILAIMEEIVALPELEYLSDEDVMAMVDYIADAAKDGAVEEPEVSAIAAFVYKTVFQGEATAAQKLAAIEAVYAVLENNDLLDTNAIPALKVVVDIYTALTAGEGEEQLLSDEKMFSILDKVFTTVLANKGQISEETAQNLAMEIVNDVFGDSELSSAAKAEIIMIVYTALKDNGLVTGDDIFNLLVQLADLLKVHGPEIAQGVYEYADEQGYIAALEAAVADLEVALEAKINEYINIVKPEIEDAIVNMEAELAALRNELAELKAELEEKKAELEALRGEVEDEIEDTFAPNAVTVNSAADEGKEAIDAAIAHLEAAIEVLEETIAAVEAQIAKIEAAIAELKAKLEEINANLMALVDAVKDMAAKVAHVIEVLKDAAEQTGEAAVDVYVEARDVAVAAVNVVKTAYAEAEDIAAAFVVLAETVNADLIDLYEYSIEQALAAWNSLDPAEQALIVLAVEELTAVADAKIEELYAENADEIAAFEAELEAAKGDLVELLAVIEAEIEEQAAALNAELELQLAEKLAQLEECAEEMKPVIEAEIAEIRAQIEENLAAVRAEVEAAYAEAKAALEAKIAEITAALEELNAYLEEQAAKIRAELEAAIEDLMVAYEIAVAEAKVALEALKAHIEEKLPVVEAYAKEIIEELKPVIDEIQAKVEEAIAAFEAAFIRATTDDYMIYDDSKLVAIGDASAVSASYVDKLAAELGIDFTNLATVADDKKGTTGTILDATQVIAENAAAIAEADLITVGYGNNAFTSEAIEQVIAQAYNGTPVDYDWSEYVGEEGVAYVEKALAEIEAYLMENGMSDKLPMSSITIAKAMTYLAESYAYSAVSYACYLPEVVNAIHSINSDAVVVVVGMNNSFAGATLTMEDTVIALGDYIKYLVEGANLHGVVYAMLSGNCIYVAAPDAETDLTNGEFGIIDFVLNYGRNVSGNPTDAGHEYIKDQILDALNISHYVPEAPAPEGLFRLKGKDRYKTGLAVADELKEILGVEKFETVVVAYGEKFPDALTGSYLASKHNAPILLTDKKVDADVIAYVKENVVSGGKVYILGGTAAVSQAFEDGVKALGFNVERLKGKDRYGTNLAILEEAGVDATTEILIATGNNYADSLSASATGLPMLLVNKNLTAEQKAFLEGTSKDFAILGGTAAVSEAIENELNAIGTSERVKGKSRYETSIVIAERYFGTANAIVLAYGEGFPDGLCGGALATQIGAALVLTENTKLAAADAYVEGVKYGYVTGGTARLTDETVREIFDVDATTEIVVKE